MIDKEIIKIASNTENHGVIDNHTHFSKLKNAICGDEMKVYLLVENNKVMDLKYECESCIYCQASVSLLSRNAKNQSIEEIKNFAKKAKNSFDKKVSFNKAWKDFSKIMTNNNIARKECLLLPINAAVDALCN
jgi:nitrogen fixation protein NifU and related proteins